MALTSALLPADLRGNPWFHFGLAIRIAAVLLLVPDLQSDGYTPFMVRALSAPGLDPWTGFLNQTGYPPDFFAGPVMLLVQAPFVGLGMLAGSLAGNAAAGAQVALGATLLMVDYLLLRALRRLHQGAEGHVLCIYWLSPIVLFITYWYGDTDVVPALLMVLGLLLLKQGMTARAGIVFGLAIGAKLVMIALLPFLAVFLWTHRRHRDRLPRFLVGSLATILLLLGPPLLFSPALHQMLLHNPKLLLVSPGMVSILDIDVAVGAGHKLYLMPLVYLLGLYGAWTVGRMSFSLLSIVLGVAFLVVLLLTPSAVGWYLWLVPFLVAYRLRAERRGMLLVLAFSAAFVLHKLIMTPMPGLPLLGLESGAMPFLLGDAEADLRLSSLLFSMLTALGMVLALTMLRRGLEENDFFGLSQHPVAIGIAGDSGTGKDTLALSLAGLFAEGAVTGISGDDYHLFERRGKLWQAFTHLDPRANDLEGFTRDALSLIEWRPIHCRHYDHATGLFTPPRRIQASDVVMVTGLHALYPPQLRERLDLAAYLDMDEALRRFFKIRRDVRQRGHAMEKVLASIERRMPDFEAFIRPQRDHADVVFSLLPADPELIRNPDYLGPVPLKLRVRIRSAVNIDRLARLLIALCGTQVDVTQAVGHRMAELVIDGSDVQAEDIQLTAQQMVPHLEELLARRPNWQAGMTGIMQLIILLQLAELRPKRR
ncbi:phosphoribulokinase/uridine kinase [Pseudoroseomonas globiformis]|uniref:phosphoribulokinase n=1 Tax=Teichococcus globiformis TaxID=2307229 RepID=A0ABV7FZX7_9PROT